MEEKKCCCAECAKKEMEAKKDVSEVVENVVPQISIDDFEKIELRVGKVLECEKVENADKLLKSRIQIGDEVRTIVSGIAMYYKPEEMVGKNVVVVANLKPAKLRGIVSEGMILCASTDDALKVVSPEGEIANGAEVR